MSSFKNLIGSRFGRLTVVDLADDYVDPRGRHRKRYKCVCDCGNEKIIIGESLSRGLTLSCGCLQKERASDSRTTHGLTNSRLYHVWCGMKRRCNNPKEKHYSLYGGRGIKVCEEWMSFENFYQWSMTHGYQDDVDRGVCTLDRIDVNGDYEPDNCRWATQQEQMNNVRYNRRITYNGETHTIAEWAREYDMPYQKLRQRISRYGYDIERALTTP